MEYYNPTINKTFHRNTNTRTQLKQGAWKWIEGAKPFETHNPTHEQLIEAGYYERVDVSCNYETNKLIDGEVIDGETISRKVAVPLTSDELTTNTQAKLYSDLAELDGQIPLQAFDDMWLILTGQETHASLLAKYREIVGDDTALLPIDAWVQRKATRRDKG